jgi:2-dehydro-3-deoxyphosphogalactonate aldolase
MKITDVKFYPLKIRNNAKGGVYWFLLKLSTDTGASGWGEIIWNAYDPDTLRSMVKDLADNYICGADPFQIEKNFSKIYSKHCKMHTDLSTMGIISGFEIACWDIIGKETGQPIYNLLGGKVNERIRAYTYLYEKEDKIFCEDFWQLPEECSKRAKEYVDMGFTAVKLDPLAPYLDSYAVHMPARETLIRAEKTIKGIREAVGENCDIIIGTHGQFTAAGAIRVANYLEKYDPLWFEEPTPPENYSVLKKVSEAITIPIATGERLSTKYEYAGLLAEQSCDIFQLDLSGVGGILEAKKIAAMAEAWHTQITTHFWAGPVNFAAQLQLAACCPNFLIQEAIETMGAFGGFDKIMKEPFQWDAGYFIPSNKPGLGIELDEEKMKQYIVEDYDETNILI